MNVQSEGGLKRRFAKTIKEARLGVREAQYDVGLMYANGLGVARNLQHAVYWIQKAAEKGLSNAQYLLGTRYASGIGVEEDPIVAQFWLEKAAAQEHPKAFLRLGVLFSSRHSAISRGYFEHAVALGVADASFYLGRLAENDSNWKVAAGHYAKAAQAGSARASYALGKLHFLGRIETEDTKRAIECFRKAARVNYPPALVALHESDKAGRGRRAGNGGNGVSAAERRRALVDWASTLEADDDFARFCLGQMYEDGIKVPKSQEEAKTWYSAAAKLGNALAIWALARYAQRDGSIDEWVMLCRRAADAGISQAQLALAEYLLAAPGETRNTVDAIRLLSSAANTQNAQAAKMLACTYLKQENRGAYAAYLLAAQLGDPEAQCWVGLAHKEGKFGADLDLALAAHWLEASAHGGHTAAQAHFAGLLMTGIGVPHNVVEAFKWYLVAAEGGNPIAQWNVSNCFLRGIGGIEKDLKQAYLWCLRSAQQGFPPAQASQGVFLLKMGKTDEALDWLHKAAQSGDGEAQFNLCVQLEKFPEKADHYGAAVQWCMAAANSNIFAAQTSLGVRYATGVGLPMDPIEAHKWFLIAARSGNAVGVENLSRSTMTLNQLQLEEAERRVQGWLAHGKRR